MSENKNNQGSHRSQPQPERVPERQPIREQGEYNQRHSNDRTTTTSQKPSPGPRE